MRNFLILILSFILFNNLSAQVNFEEKVNIFDYDSLGVNFIYDDFDNDNDLDLIKYGVANSANVLLQKNQNGDFNSNLSSLVKTGVNPIMSLDLNNDTFPDLLTYHSFNTIGVLYNLQNDTFSDEVTVQTFNGSYSIYPMKFDFNNDGFMDLIAVDNNNIARVLINNQSGSLDPGEFLLPVDTFDRIYQIHDFDNDGNYDIYIRDGDILKIYIYDVNNDENDETDDFVNPFILQVDSSLRSYGILDLDGNGFKDILYWKNGSIWAKYFDFNSGTDQFVVLNDVMVVDNIPRYSNYANTSSIHIENVDNGIYDVYITLETAENQLDMLKFNYQGSVFSDAQIVLSDFQINSFGADRFDFLDLNNDNNLDFTFFSNFNENKMIFINNNINDSPDKTICIQGLVRPNDFTIIDMNGDGEEDICVGTQNGLGYYEITPDDELSGLRNLIGVMSNPNASSYTINHITDINNDGLGDVVDFANYGNEAKIYKNLGDDNFEFVQSVSMNGLFLPGNLSFADIDTDGYQDLVFFNNDEYSGNGFYWIKNNNGINFNSPEQIIVNNVNNLNQTSFSFEDFNNDNQTDILVLRYFFEGGQWNTEVNLLENNDGNFSGSVVASLGGNYGRSHIKINDFDQDGNLDFFVYSIRLDQPFVFFKNDGQNSFTQTIIGNIDIEDIEFYDGDSDGINEIYAWNHNESSFTNNIFYYTTTDYSSFSKVDIDSYSATFDSSDPTTRGDLLLYDYDNDGKKDLFIDNFSAFQALISVYKNISESLGIEEIENTLNRLKLYPNPFVNTISWNNINKQDYKIQLYSQDGKLIYSKTTSASSLDLSSFNSGVYFLSIEEVNSIYKNVYKIVKE